MSERSPPKTITAMKYTNYGKKKEEAMHRKKKKWHRLSALIFALLLMISSVVVYAEEPEETGSDTQEILEGGDADNPLGLSDNIMKYVGHARGDLINYNPNARTANGQVVTITPGTTIHYGSWATCKFDIDGKYAGYCAEPNSPTPSGSYTAYDYNNDLIKILLMCAPGGPLDGKIPGYPEGSIFYDPNVSGGNMYANAHACIGYVYSGSAAGLSTSYLNGIKRMIELAEAVKSNNTVNYDPNADWEAWKVMNAPNNSQDIVWLEGTPRKGIVKVSKSSADPSITEGNACYSLAGAVYGIYTDEACTANVGTLTTGEDGISNEVELKAGQYYIKEEQAPKGFALDKKVYPVTVNASQPTVFEATDRPTMDPVGVLLGKIDKETNLNKPQGSASLEGALFEMKYYGGDPSDTDPGAEGKAHTRKWVFRTNGNGFAEYNNQFLESGDELYISQSGIPSLPVGTLTIQETKAPEGYLLNSEIYVVPITSSNDGSEFVYTYNEPKIPEQSLNLTIVKREKGKEIVIEGAVFELIRPDGTKETLTTDDKGKCEFKGLGYGQHTIKETSAPPKYTLNAGEVKFTVNKDNSIQMDSNTSKDGSMKFEVGANGIPALTVEDALSPFTLQLKKVNDKNKLLEGAEFTLYADPECKKEVSKTTTGTDGTAKFTNLAVETKYYLKETKAPQGYRIPQTEAGKDDIYEIYTKYNDSQEYEYYVNGKVHTSGIGDFAITGTPDNRVVNLKIVNVIGLQMPETGSPFTPLLPGAGAALMSAACACGAVLYHRKKQIREENYEKKE